MNVGFLGPAYSFSERAASKLAHARPLESCNDIAEMLTALEQGRLGAAVLPYDNSEVGHVSEAAAALLARGAPFAVTGETVLPIRFSLYRRKGDREQLKRVISHSMSLKQCARWLAARELALEEVGSNGIAFIRAREADGEDTGAICPSGIAHPDMIEIETDLQGADAFRTRFLLVEPLPKSGEAKRALVTLEELSRICEGIVPARAYVLACLPTGTLGARTLLAELAFDHAVAVDTLPGRPLLIWPMQATV